MLTRMCFRHWFKGVLGRYGEEVRWNRDAGREVEEYLDVAYFGAAGIYFPYMESMFPEAIGRDVRRLIAG